MIDAARRAALDLLDAVLIDARRLSDLLPDALSHLGPSERARAQRLAVETLRWADRADRMLGPFLQRRPPPRVLNALRLGTVELCVDGVPAHGTVNALVDLVKLDRATRAQAGLLNAVLRKVAASGPEAWAALPPPRLPRPIRKRIVAAWGKEATEGIEAAHAAGAPLDLTPRDGDAARLAARLGGTALPTGSVRVRAAGQVSTLPGYDEGEWWVQDAAAALPVRLATPRPGERALDLCAAPGGKTLQLAAAGAEVTAVDISETRLGRLRQNLDRCRLSATTVIADATEWEGGTFDIVLLDAPCSATGTIRRHPDLPYALDLESLPSLLALQTRLLDRAVAALAPGGRLIWCTCSLLPEEGEYQVAQALDRHSGLGIRACSIAGADEWDDGAGGIRVRPDFWSDRGGLDGFHMARLERDR